MTRKRWLLLGSVAIGAFALVALDRSLILPWPQKGIHHIDFMSQLMKDKQRPGSWCDPSSHPANLLLDEHGHDIGKCTAHIKPVTEFIEQYQGTYVKRIYRGKSGNLFCEYTLSSFSHERNVGSDCYYGLFDQNSDEGIGMTDDPFG